MKTKIIGLTGGIGSGKTTVAKMFEQHGFPVYVSDDRAKILMQQEKTIKSIVSVFGTDILSFDKIDKKKLAKIVFNDGQKLKVLNSIIHPLVKDDFVLWLKNNNKTDFVIKESAILFETGGDVDCYKIISVTAPIDIRIERVMTRDGVSAKEVNLRIDKQISDTQRIAKSDFVISNHNIISTKMQVDKIVKGLQDEVLNSKS